MCSVVTDSFLDILLFYLKKIEVSGISSTTLSKKIKRCEWTGAFVIKSFPTSCVTLFFSFSTILPGKDLQYRSVVLVRITDYRDTLISSLSI